MTSNVFGSINKNSAYISRYSQKTEILYKDTTPITRTRYEIVFKFNDEKSITLHRNYTIYYSHFDKLDKIEAWTENPMPNGKTKKIENKDFTANSSGSSDVFYDDQQEININFLGLTIGSEAHVEYTVITDECHFTDPMTFRYYLPIEEVIYELTVPENMNVSFIEKNLPKDFLSHTMKKNRNETIHTWIAKDVEEEKQYDSAPSRLYFTPHVLYKIDDYTLKGKTRTVSKSPADLYQWYINNIKNVNSKPSERIQQLSDSIVKGATTRIEKVKRIFNWVQHNIRYVAFEAGMEGIVPREAEAVCMKRYGDCKDMSSIQFALLKAAGIEAHLVWIGTRRIPYTYSEVPLKNTDNHMIAAVKENGEWIFLDATDPNGIFGLPSDHIQGKQAMINMGNTGYELVTVPVIDAKTNYMTEICTFQILGNNVEINTRVTHGGLLAGNLANQLHYLTEKDKEEFAKSWVKSVSNNAILKNHGIPKLDDYSGQEMTLNYTIKDYVKEVDKEKYINLFLDKSFMNSGIADIDKRQVPYGFKFNSTNTSTYILNIPENYHVTYVPQTTSFKEKEFGFSIDYTQEKNTLICRQKVFSDFPDLLMKSDQFARWNEFVKQLNNAYKESIILEKN
ncbi:MAG: DUF3857 domain-containing protein [Chitinophagaceae bacterium]|nr:DUF3857 domain-containing protein [Chitinophagaceae bacterium]